MKNITELFIVKEQPSGNSVQWLLGRKLKLILTPWGK